MMLMVFLSALLSLAGSVTVQLPRDLLLRAGDARRVQCVVRDCADGDAQFTWKTLEDKPIYGNFETGPLVSTLIYSNVKKQHENRLLCTARCQNEQKQATVRVRVYSFPNDPVISGHERLILGEQNTLTCEVSDIYPAEYMTVEWLRGGKVLHTQDGEFETSVIRSSYTFEARSEDDGQQITCRASLGVMGLADSESSRETTVSMSVLSSPQQVRFLGVDTVLLGSTLSLTCEADGKPEPTFSWSVVRSAGQSVTVGHGRELSLLNVTRSDAGVYKCEASNMLGNTSATVSVVIHGPPMNTVISASPKELREGQSLVITCLTDTGVTPQVRVVLIREEDGKETELKSGVGSNLTWFTNSSSLRDSGVYVCKVFNQYGSQRANLTLTVHTYPLKVSLHPDTSVTQQLGSTLLLSCEASHCPQPHFHWTGLDIQPAHKWLDSQRAISQLGPRPTELKDNRSFSCEVTCGSVMMTKMTKVKVFSFPSDPIIESSGPSLEGEVTKLTCTVHNVFPAERFRIRWMDGETELHSEMNFTSEGLTDLSSTISYQPVRADAPTITCQVSLEMEAVPAELTEKTASTTLTLHYAPRGTTLSVTPGDKPREGETVRISCVTDSAPWGRLVLRRVLNGEETELISSQTPNISFTIPSAQLSDSGTYECEAYNGHGSHKASTQITVQAPPRNTTVRVLPSALVQEGQNVSICCLSVSSPPPVITLRKLQNGSDIYSPDGTFLLVRFTSADAGLYQINVSNDLGYETEIFTIDVMERYSSPPPSYNMFITPVLGLGLLVSMVAALDYLRKMKKKGIYQLTKCKEGTV